MPAKKRQQYRHLPAFILLVLAQGEAHGGAIYSALNDNLPLFQADTGAIYRTLQQMEKEGAVTSVWNITESGPARKIYRITPAGWNKLDSWKHDIELRRANLNYFLTTYEKLKGQKD